MEHQQIAVGDVADEHDPLLESRALRARWLLAAGFGVILSLVVAVLVVVHQNLKSEAARLKEGTIALEKNRQAFNMLKTTFPGIYQLARVPQLEDYFDVDNAIQIFNSGSRDFVIARDLFLEYGIDQEEEQMFAALTAAVSKARPLIHDFFKHTGDTVEHVGDPARRADMAARLEAVYGPYHDVIDVLDRLTRKQINTHQQRLDELRADFDLALFQVAAMGVLIVLVGGTVALYVIWRESQYRHALLQEIYERRRAETTAERSSKAKSEFLANMSHELRTPLNAVLGFAEMIRAQPFGPIGNDRYAGYADDIHKSGRHLLELINDILDLSAVEAGKLTLADEEVDVARTVDECLNFVRPVADGGGVTLTVLDSVLLRGAALRADGRRIRQMLINLLSNAVKFTPSGGAVSIGAVVAGNGDFVVSVTDTGIGMGADEVETALSPFGTVQSVYDGRYEGTGLGLPLTRKLVEAHGGRLEIESAADEGTTVSLVFPADRLVG